MSGVDLNRARDEMDQLCHACAFDVGPCRCVIECGAINCLGAVMDREIRYRGGRMTGRDFLPPPPELPEPEQATERRTMSGLPLFVWVPNSDDGYDIWALDEYTMRARPVLSPEDLARWQRAVTEIRRHYAPPEPLLPGPVRDEWLAKYGPSGETGPQ